MVDLEEEERAAASTANRHASFSVDNSSSSAATSPLLSSPAGSDPPLRSPARPLSATKALLAGSLMKRRKDLRAGKGRQQQHQRPTLQEGPYVSSRSSQKGDGGAGARGKIEKGGDDEEGELDGREGDGAGEEGGGKGEHWKGGREEVDQGQEQEEGLHRRGGYDDVENVVPAFMSDATETHDVAVGGNLLDWRSPHRGNCRAEYAFLTPSDSDDSPARPERGTKDENARAKGVRRFGISPAGGGGGLSEAPPVAEVLGPRKVGIGQKQRRGTDPGFLQPCSPVGDRDGGVAGRRQSLDSTARFGRYRAPLWGTGRRFAIS